MAIEESRQVNDGLNVAKESARIGAKGSKKAGRATYKGGRRVYSILPPKAKIAVAIVLVLVILIAAVAEGADSSSFKRVARHTAQGEEPDYNYPETEDAAYESIYEKQVTVEDTISLAKVIHDTEAKDLLGVRDTVESSVRSAVGRANLGGGDIDYSLTIEKAKSELTERSNYVWEGSSFSGPSGNSSSGAQAAVDWAIQIANDDSFNYGVKNADGGYANAPGCYFCGTNDRKVKKSGDSRYYKTYVCMTFVTAAYAHGANDPEVLALCKKCNCLSSHDGLFNQVSCFEKIGLMKELTVDDLQPGDVLVHYASDDSSGHMSIYAGNGDIVDASGGGFTSRSISLKKGAAAKYLKGTFNLEPSKNFVMRYKGNGSGGNSVSTGGVSHNAQQVIEGACTWAVAIAEDDSFHYGYGGAAHHNGCYFCNTQPKSKRNGTISQWEKTYCCNPFVHAAFAHGGGEPTMLEVCKGYGSWTDSNYNSSPLFKNLGKPMFSSLQRGDVFTHQNGHVSLYIGDGKLVEAANGDDNKPGSKRWKESIQVTDAKSRYNARGYGVKSVYRYVGNGGGTMEMPDGASNTTSSQFTKKDGYTTIDEINSSTGTRRSIGYVSGTSSNCAQSFAYIDNKFAVCIVESNHAPSYVRLYDTRGHVLASTRADSIGHANAACATADGELIVGGSTSSSSSVAHKFHIGDSVSGGSSIFLPSAGYSLAYDRDTEKYIIATSGTFYVYDKNLKTKEASFSRSMHKLYPQDIGAANGYIFACQTQNKNGKNFIDIYNEKTGDYCGSYKVNYGELESCDVVNGELVLLVHTLGHENYIHYTGIKIDSNGSSPLATNYITLHDMDILSAYNVSISNTSMYLNRGDDDENIGEDSSGWLDDKAYRDVSGRKLKLYWFGKNRGQINYEKDLKSKIDKILKGNAVETVPVIEDDVSTSQADPSVDTPSWNLLLVNADNAIPSGYSVNTSSIETKYVQGNKESKTIDSRVLSSLHSMLKACEKAGHTPLVVSAYREHEDQVAIYGDGSDPLVAVPGHSEHECGLAADIIDNGPSALSGDPLVDAQENLPAQKWLMANCQNYGFILRYPKDKEDITGIGYEPWHYRYVGVENAKAIMSGGLCLEEYLGAGSASKKETSKTEAVSGNNKHFYKITIATTPVSSGGRKYLPVTVAEREVSDLMQTFFDLDPSDEYIGSKGAGRAAIEAGNSDGKGTYLINTKNDVTTNLDVTYAMSMNTGMLIFGGLQKVQQNPDFLSGAMGGSFGGNGGSFSGGVTVGSEEQKKILDYISYAWPEGSDPYHNGYGGLCEKWVCDMYKGAGIPIGGQHCCAAANRESNATQGGEIPPGAMIYSSPSVYSSSYVCEVCGRNCGHVGIYLGNDRVAGSQPPYIMSLSQWTQWYGVGGWSFSGNSF